MARMNRNRKKEATLVSHVPRRGVLTVLAVFGIWMGFLSIKTQCDRLGAEIKKLESSCELNQRRLANEESKWAALMTPRTIEETLTRHGLDLGWPRRGQVVRIYDSQAPDAALADMREAIRFAELERVALNE